MPIFDRSKWYLLLFFPVILIFACSGTSKPPNAEENTEQQVENDTLQNILSSVMEANGGQEAWENTKLLQWNFFGNRAWWWDKHTGDIRCEYPKFDLRVAMQIHSRSGQLWLNGAIINQPDSVKKYLDRVHSWWINDSYWLVMPFKLEDPGVDLKYIGQKETQVGRLAHAVEMTFDDVGNTPENKYHIYIDPESFFVIQWDFYRKASDQEPAFSRPWTNYQKYGEIMLSDGRGSRSLSDIAVYSSGPGILFSDLTKPGKTLLSVQ